MINGLTAPVAGIDYSAVADADTGQCTKLIRKLRWIGLEEEADRLERALRIVAPEQRGTVCAEPYSTD
jgi:hypothetical protein